MKEKKERAKRLPTFAESITPIVAMLLILTIGKGVFGYSTEPLLIMVAAIAAFIAFRVGITWDEMMDEICTKIAKGMPAILILVCVGAMVGTWMASGTIPMMIYYGVQIVNPKFMLVTAFLIEAVVSVVTGTSWGSVATMGVALMGIASALGVSLPATAGACIAGSYFGDKMSPLSDTTNLAPIAAGSTLYEHIGHMFYTTVPATIVSLVVYAIVGMNADVSADITSDTVTTLLSQLSSMYSWNLLIIIPVVIVLGGSLLQKPTIPVMLLSTFVAGLESVFIQHVALGDVLKATVNGFDVSMIHRAGFDTETCSEAVTKLLNRGGMNGIMSTTLLVFCAFCFAGIMSRAGCLDVVLQKILSVAKSTGALITATVAACITMALTTGNSYLAILIPGEMFRDAYKERGLAAKNLSRTLEDADVSDEQGDGEMTPVTEDTDEEQTEGSEDISKEDSVEPTQEDADNTDTTDETVNTEKDKKDKSVSIFGYDLSEITKNAGEEASKGFSKIEKYLKEHFAFNEESNDDKDANVENPNTDEKISNVAKTLLDAYYDALATEKDSAASGNEDASESTGEDAEAEKTEQASEAFLNKVKELLNDGKISEDDAKKLEKEFAKTNTEDGDIEDEMTESDAGNGSSKGDDTEAVAAE